MIISIHHHSRNPDRWRHSGSEGASWPTIAEATQAAIDWARGQKDVEGFTGHADREILHKAGLRFMDSRGNRRRGAGAQARQRAIMAAKMAARRELAARGPVEACPCSESQSLHDNTPAGGPIIPEKTAPKLSSKKLKALETARQNLPWAASRKPPEGYRSVEHFLDDAREYVGSHQGATAELAAYLRVNESSVRKWIKREKIPLQPTIDSIARWLRTKKV